MKSIANVLLLLLPAASVQAQQTVPSVDTLVSQLYTYGQEYIAKLPSLSCDETVTSQVVKNGKVQKDVRVQSSLREVRQNAASNEFQEIHHFASVDGEPTPPKFTLPLFPQGVFANALAFKSDHPSPCLTYQLASQDEGRTVKLDMAANPKNTDPACARLPDGYRETVLIDSASGKVESVERSLSEEGSKRSHQPSFTSMEYGPQKMGDETLWLPIRMIAHDPKDERRVIVTYSNYHRYTANSTILPVDSPVDTK